MATWVKGKTRVKAFATAASTAYLVGDLIAYPATQDNTIIVSTSTTDKQLGICLQAKAASDTTTDPILVEVAAEPFCEFECATTSLVATDVGGYFDLTDARTVNRGATANDAVVCTSFLSATLGRFMLNSFVGTHSETWP